MTVDVWVQRVARLSLVVCLTVTLGACGGAPPQIVDYSPLRGATNVSTAAPISVTFDHDVDQASVASRFHLVPDAPGSIHWSSGRAMTYEHSALRPSTTNEVVIDAGYRDLAGNVYTLRHHWSFITEAPPAFSASSPADGTADIDPADFLYLDFTRAMNEASLKSAISFSPSVPFTVRIDPADTRRAIVAPDTLLDPRTAYVLLVTTTALDVDGSPIDRVRTVRFTTGGVRPLHHWIAFSAQHASALSRGIWIVNESGIPRQLVDTTILQSFSWSPEGDRLVYEGDAGAWSVFAPGQGSTSLGFNGPWAAALGAGFGYAYLDVARDLHRVMPDGTSSVIGTSVVDVAVSAAGERLVYAGLEEGGSTQIWGYDVGLRSRYVLATESGAVSGLAWAPAGNRIAYVRLATGSMTIRVRNLSGAAATTTVAQADVGPPSWLRDSDHLVFAATVKSPGGSISKAFLVNVVAPPASLTLAQGLPTDPAIDVASPVPSPDGHQIAFITADQVWLMNADGTRPTPLTRYDAQSFPYSCLMPAWTRS